MELWRRFDGIVLQFQVVAAKRKVLIETLRGVMRFPNILPGPAGIVFRSLGVGLYRLECDCGDDDLTVLCCSSKLWRRTGRF